MASKSVPITGSVLSWAIDQSGLTLDQVASHLDVTSEELLSWISGDGMPSLGQARKLSDYLKRPLSVLLLPSPPEPGRTLTSLRSASGAGERSLNPDEVRQARRARRLQQLISWIVTKEHLPAAQIPNVSGQDPVLAGSSLRNWLQVAVDEQIAWASPREAFDEWRTAFEAKGIVVLQLQLGKGIRGLCLYDEIVPVIAVDTADNYQARSFTLFHELAHLASRSDSACLERTGNQVLETWCERVASSALLLRESLQQFMTQSDMLNRSDVDIVRKVSEVFKTSLRASALAMIRDGWLKRGVYEEIEEQAPVSDREKGFGRGTPQRAPQRRKSEFGRRPLSLVFRALNSQLITERDARSYLRLDGTELGELEAEVQIA